MNIESEKEGWFSKIVSKIGSIWSSNNDIYENGLVFEVCNANDKDFNKFVKKYEKKIIKLSNKCFNEDLTELPIPNGNYVIAKLNGKLVASLVVYFEGYKSLRPWIWNMCRDPKPECWGTGIGKELMKYTLNYIKELEPEYHYVHLYASQNPVSRIEYYKSFGFIETDNYDEDGDLEMIYDLYQ